MERKMTCSTINNNIERIAFGLLISLIIDYIITNIIIII